MAATSLAMGHTEAMGAVGAGRTNLSCPLHIPPVVRWLYGRYPEPMRSTHNG